MGVIKTGTELNVAKKSNAQFESSISLDLKEREFEDIAPVDGFSHILVDQSLDSR
jgi:hypothetical protein